MSKNEAHIKLKLCLIKILYCDEKHIDVEQIQYYVHI